MSKTKDSRFLIIPDVHGRTFWKEAVQTQEYDKVIFLGDYVDPYEDEGISDVEAYQNFTDILRFKQEHEEKVVLLLGNHDLHYASLRFRANACGSRYYPALASVLQNLFEAHHTYFKLAYQVCEDQRYLFTHAGVNTAWFQRNASQIQELLPHRLNHLLTTQRGIDALAEISPIRGGNHPTGSMVWADVDEMKVDTPFEGVYQIFGHSLAEEPVITEHFACLDCRKAFMLQHGEISEVKG